MSRTSLSLIAVALSALLAAALLGSHFVLDSQLALAMGADSLLDVVTASLLLWAVRVALQPADEEHPFGHHRAEPAAALVAAVFAAILAFNVFYNAADALITGRRAELAWWLVAVFATKVIAKLAIFALARTEGRRERSPAMDALAIDARNDVIVSAVAIAGYFAARYGWPMLDAWLALPAALMIAQAGWSLATENLQLLMGASPEPERIRELEAMARAIDGVEDAHDLRAQFLGTHLQVYLHVVVDPTITVLEAHDIGEAVEHRLQAEGDVHHCFVHIDIK